MVLKIERQSDREQPFPQIVRYRPLFVVTSAPYTKALRSY
jgi:hypothetical protein